MKTQLFVLIICIAATYTIQAQSANSVTTASETIAMVANEKPTSPKKANVMTREASFPGGMKAMNKFLSKNLKYSAVAQSNCFEGTVMVKFSVNSDGSLTEFQVMKSDNPNLNEQALNIVKAMPNWEPAVKGGFYTTRKVIVPIQFSLR